MNIIIAAHFTTGEDEPGNCRFHNIARLLADCGHDVEVITSSFWHAGKKQRNQNTKYPYKVTYIEEPDYTKNVSLKRILSHRICGKNVKKYLNNLKSKPDVIYCAVPSLSFSKQVGKYANKNAIRFIIDVQDLWPEAFKMAIDVPVISDIMFWPMKIMANAVYQLADDIVAVSETYAKRASRVNLKYKHVMSVFLGTSLNEFDRYANSGEHHNNCIKIVYIGTLGKSYNIRDVILAINKLPKDIRQKVKFIIMGSGPYEERLKDECKLTGIDAVFTGKMNYPDMVKELMDCDIAVNPIVGKSVASIINKVGDYAAAGLPVVNTLASEEYRQLLIKYNAGINCSNSSEDIEKALEKLCIDRKLRILMGHNNRRLAEDYFDRDKQYQKIVHLMDDIAEELG